MGQCRTGIHVCVITFGGVTVRAGTAARACSAGAGVCPVVHPIQRGDVDLSGFTGSVSYSRTGCTRRDFTVPSLSPRILGQVPRYQQVVCAVATAVAGVWMTAACSSSSVPPVAIAGTPSASGGSSSARPDPAAVAPGVTVSRVQTVDGSVVTVAVFHGPVQFVLHNGSRDPGSRYSGLLHAGPVITGAERQRLLAAFNGGFLLSSHSGGYEQEGHVIRGLRTGLGTVVIDRSGHARVGAWGAGLPVPGEAVYSARQNLGPLLIDGRPAANMALWHQWGGTLAHAEYVARSALGQDSAGDLLYAASMSTIPADLASALARHGARSAMELDINPEWVQLDTARSPGGPLTAAVPGQVRPASQYLTGWTRDFIAVVVPAAK